MKIKKKIVLIGMMGSGKSTIGALLSKKMNMKFIDIDSKIETIEKQTISQIFKLKGEKYLIWRNIYFYLRSFFRFPHRLIPE